MRPSPSVLQPRHFLLLAALIGGACNCDQTPLSMNKPGSCEPTFACPTGYEYRLGDCHAARCSMDADCCPGQKCNAAAGSCYDTLTMCTSDDACTKVPGQTCIEFRTGRFCGYPNKGNMLNVNQTQACASDADCDPDRSCFGKRCVTTAPCNGGCAMGQICDVDSDSCYPMPGCNMQCTTGQILVVADPDTESGAQCCKLECACETLPPVRPGQYGWYASIGLLQTDLAVSAYDETYGDLVVARFDSMGALKNLDYVDGMPTSGPVVGDPKGLRGGRSDPGPNVGEYSSLAVDPMGNIHISYYDRTMGALRYANNAGGSWQTTVVDAEGDVGHYTSIKIAPDGTPRIAYMMTDGVVGADPTKRTALKYATAHMTPALSPAAWTTEIVDNEVKPIPPCNAGCGANQACVDLGAGPTCAMTTIGCGSCDTSSACVQTASTSTTVACKAKVEIVPIDDLIPGVGLFASLALTSTGSPVIAYYDRIQRVVRLARADGSGGWNVDTIDGGDPMHPVDVGQHTSVAISSTGTIGVAYYDATHENLIYYDVASATREVVDNGVTPPNIRMVGADASLIFDDSDRPAIAYQDPTNIEVLYARRLGMPAMWSTEVLRGAPAPGATRGTASGFYTSQVRRGMTAYIASVDVTFTPDDELKLTLGVISKPLD
jgi:hypothetical protein